MMIGLLHAHSTLRWIILALILAAGIKSLMGWLNKSSYDSSDDKLALFSLIAIHTQILIGFGLYFLSGKVNFEAISNPAIRYFTIEHGFLMLLAATLITVGRIKSKKKEDGVEKHKIIAFSYISALIIIVVTVFLMMP